MNADRRLVSVISVFVNEVQPARLCEIDLIRRERELATDHAPDLHVDFWAVKRRFVSDFHVINS
jgi:hypothetical protein